MTVPSRNLIVAEEAPVTAIARLSIGTWLACCAVSFRPSAVTMWKSLSAVTWPSVNGVEPDDDPGVVSPSTTCDGLPWGAPEEAVGEFVGEPPEAPIAGGRLLECGVSRAGWAT